MVALRLRQRCLSLFGLFFILVCPVRAQEETRRVPAPQIASLSALLKATLLRLDGKYAEAVKLLQKHPPSKLDTPRFRKLYAESLADAHVKWADELEAKDQYAAAIKHFTVSYNLNRSVEAHQVDAATDLAAIGLAYEKLGQHQKALSFLRKAQDLYHKLHFVRGERIALQSMGQIYQRLALLDLRDGKKKPLTYSQKAQVLFHQAGDAGREAQTLSITGLILERQNRKTDAFKAYHDAISLFHQAKGSAEEEQAWMIDAEAEAWMATGFLYVDLRKYLDALPAFQNALSLYQQTKNEKEETARQAAASMYFFSDEEDTALRFYQTNLTLYQKRKDAKREAETLCSMGEVYEKQENYDKALECLQKALPLYRTTGNLDDYSDTLRSMGNVYSAMGRRDKALKTLCASLSLAQASGKENAKRQAETLNDIAFVYFFDGRLVEAMICLRAAQNLYKKEGNISREAQTLDMMNLLYQSQGRYDQAREVGEKAVRLYHQAHDDSGEGSALHDLALIYQALGQYDLSASLMERAHPLLQQSKNISDEVRSLVGLGTNAAGQGRDKDAITYWRAGLALAQKKRYRVLEAFALAVLSISDAKRGEFPGSLEKLNQSLEVTKKANVSFGQSLLLSGIGMAHWRSSDPVVALQYFYQAQQISHQNKETALEALALSNLMFCLGDESPVRDKGLAILYGKESVNLTQQIRGNIRTFGTDIQQGYAETNRDTYRYLADLLISEGRLPEALYVLDLIKQKEVFDYVRRDPKQARVLDGRIGLTKREQEAYARYLTLTEEITRLGAELASALEKNAPSDQQNKIKDKLGAANIVFAAYLRDLSKRFVPEEDRFDVDRVAASAKTFKLTLGELNKSTGQKTAAIYTLLYQNKLHFIVVTPTASIAREVQINGEDLKRKIGAFIQVLQQPRRDPRLQAKDLYDVLIKPIEGDLNGAQVDTVMWSLDGLLRYVPLEALSPDGKTYLIEKWAGARFTNSGSGFLKDANRPRTEWGLLGVGVSKAHPGFDALPGVRDELFEIHKLVAGNVLLDEQFNKKRFLDLLEKAHGTGRQYSMIHIATHFSLNPTGSNESYLLMGDGSKLLLSDVVAAGTLFNGVDLLTLSSCNTGVGGSLLADKSDKQGAQAGREIDSLAVCIQDAGAKSVIATLWPVADTSTAALMQAFYRIRQAQPSTTKLRALREAQMALLSGDIKGVHHKTTMGVGTSGSDDSSAPVFTPDPEKPFAHPYYWAGFVLIGNWR